MRTLETWLSEYAESHQNPVNKTIHHFCVPLIMFSLLGLLWLIPGVFYNQVPVFLNLAVLLAVCALPYYFFLSRLFALGMLVISSLMITLIWWLFDSGAPLFEISILIFIFSWIGQFIGHQIEGKKPSFFKDIQFLLIGPLWVLAHLYRRLGIRWQR
ncbi:MAG: DUF962 domain-containing protein [Gammaproteobacteria bacterium]|nr:MAG: DUF962 domain-containing protein [Gammaproteobacteria bacterium]